MQKHEIHKEQNEIACDTNQKSQNQLLVLNESNKTLDSEYIR